MLSPTGPRESRLPRFVQLLDDLRNSSELGNEQHVNEILDEIIDHHYPGRADSKLETITLLDADKTPASADAVERFWAGHLGYDASQSTRRHFY